MKRDAVIFISLMSLALLAGCRGKGTRAGAAGQPYFGPTESMADVIAQINANNSAIGTLRAAGDFEASVVDKGKKHFVNGDVVVLYRRPDEVRLIGTKDIAGPIFEAGSNRERYWLTVKGDTDTMWWGRLSNLDHIDPKELPIRPDLLIEVLGIDQLNTDFLRQPVPTMRFNNDADAYMLNFNIQLPDRWAVQKEVWYDRTTKLPRNVLLFDSQGRIMLRAYLSRHEAIEETSAKIATRFAIFFPESGTTMRIDLQQTALQRRGAPNDRSFAFPTEPGVGRVIDLDEQSRS